MKTRIKTIVFELSYYLELLIASILAFAIFVMSIQFFMDMSGSVLFGEARTDLNAFLGQAMTLAVGVEFIKMLCKHTPSTVIEVLLFAIARQMVVDHMTVVDMLVGVVALAALFATRKYLLCQFDEVDHIILRAKQSVKTANALAKIAIPLEDGETLGDVMMKHLEEKEEKVAMGSCIYIKDFALRVDSMRDGKITRIEIIKTV